MILKQLPTIIGDLNKLGIALKSLDAINIGVVGLNTGNLEAYRNAIKGLSIEQSVFALSSKGATEEQIRQILVTDQATANDVEAALAKAGLTTATKSLTQAEMVELATKNGVAKATAEELLGKLGITAAEEGQVAVKRQVTLETLKQAVTNEVLTKAEADQIATMLGLNAVESANIGITNVLTASFTKLWAVITAHPIGAILTAIGAVAVGTIAYINKVNKDAEKALVEAHENAENALNETKTDLSDAKCELQSVNSELESTKQKIQDIASAGTITLAEQNELNKLSTANAQLETQKTLLENNIKLKQKDAALDAKKLLGTQVEMEYASILDGSEITSKTESYTYADHAKYEASNLKNAYNIYMNALKDGNTYRQELAQQLIDASAGDSAELTSQLLKIVKSFQYDDGTIIEGYEEIYNEYMGMIYNLQSLTNPDVFLDVVKTVTNGTNIDYEKAIADAYQLAYDGNFDIDSLNQDFVKALTDAGIDESTINYIFKLKQQEYQLLIDKINDKYTVSENPDKVTVRKDYWDADENGNMIAYSKYETIYVDKETKDRIAEVNSINEALMDYAQDNPVEFQLVTSFDEDFALLDKYISEERTKAENNADYVGDYISNAIRRVYEDAKVQSSTLADESGNLWNSESQKTFLESISNIKSGYDTLLSAQEEFAENSGKLSSDTLSKLLENNLMQYLEYTADGLQINTKALQDNERALKDTATAELYNAMCNDIQNLSFEDTNSLSAVAKTSIANLDSAATTAGENASIAAQGWWEYGASIQSIPGVKGLTGNKYKEAEAIINQYQKIAQSINSMSFEVGKSSEKSTKDTAKAITDLLDAELKALDASMEAGYIDFNDYISKRKELIKDYYRQGKISADDYYSYLEKHYKQELSYMDKVVSAVTRRIDLEIESKEKQKEAIEEYYKSEISALEKQRDILEEQNENLARKRQLEETIYNKRRSEEQRTIKQYTGKEGTVKYLANPENIREADDALKDAELDIKVAEIESAISKLEEACDRETSAINSAVDDLTRYKEQWQSVTEQYEIQQNELLAQQMLGAEWETQILNGRMDILTNFSNDYIATQQAMADAAWNAAKAQVEAQKYAASNGTFGDLGGGDNTEETQYETVYRFQNKEYSDYNDAARAKYDYITKLIEASGNRATYEDLYKSVAYQIEEVQKPKRYHTGLKQGLVDSSNNESSFDVLEKWGLKKGETPIIAQRGEGVLTSLQMDNIAHPLRIFENLVKVTAPDTSYFKNIQNNRNSTQNVTINASFPNITNETGYDSFAKNMSKFFNEANLASVQYTNRH